MATKACRAGLQIACECLAFLAGRLFDRVLEFGAVMLEFRVLGPVEAWGAGGQVALGGRQQSVLLAVLLMHVGEFVSREALIDALWPHDPPRSAASTLESYVSRLRGALHTGGARSEVIVSGPGGYRLVCASDRVDSVRFAHLAEQARDALGRGDRNAATASASEALALWRGPALAGLADQPALRAAASVLEERRVETVEVLAEAALARGEPREAIARLTAEIAQYPARERLRGLLMLALYRTGRQADALQAYQDARRYLVDELGLEPTPELRELQEWILRQDPALEDHRRARDTAPVQRSLGTSAEESSARGRSPRMAVAGLVGAAVLGAVVLIATASGGQSLAVERTLRAPAVGVLDPASGKPRAAAGLGVVATRAATGAGADWVTSYDNGTLLRIDPRRLLVTQTVAVGHGPTGVAVTAGDVWVALSIDGTVSRIDPATSATVQRIQVGTDPTGISAGDGDLWVSNTGDGTVTRVDAHTGQVLGTIEVGAKPRGIAVGAGGVWVADSAANVLVRLDPHSGRVLDRIATGQGPTQVAVGRAGVWVANDLDSTVSLVDPSNDTVTLTAPVAGIPAALAPSQNGAWLAAGDRPTLTFVPATGVTRHSELPSPASALMPVRAGLFVAVRGVSSNHRGGTLVARLEAPIPSINPEHCCDVPGEVRNLSYDGLLGLSVQPDSSGTLVPDLALSIPRPQSGGLLYTFRLRAGLRYWNGAPVRASDFRRGLERAAAASDVWAGYIGALPGALSCPRSPRACDLSRAVIANDHENTVTLKLSHPDPELLPALGLSAFAPAPASAGAIRPGTGPYRITSFTPNRQIVLQRNRYFRDSAPVPQPAGYPDKIEIDNGGAPAADIKAVLDGEADYTFDTPSPGQLAQIELHQPAQLHISPQPELDFLFMNTRAAPFNDPRVRQALNYAVDRAAIVNLIGGPAAATPICQTIPATIPGHVAYCPYTDHPTSRGTWTSPDLRKARALIAASETKGQSISVLTGPSGLASDEPTATYIVGLLKRLGYRAHLRLLQPDRWHAAMDDYHHPAQIGTEAWSVDFISASQFLTDQLSCAAWNPPTRLDNHAEFCNHHVDQLARRAAELGQIDPVAADALWARADRLATNLAPWIATVSENELDLVSRRVGDYRYLGCGACTPLDQLWVH
jgi:peptide/nickel transport system substrate-binding protein